MVVDPSAEGFANFGGMGQVAGFGEALAVQSRGFKVRGGDAGGVGEGVGTLLGLGGVGGGNDGGEGQGRGGGEAAQDFAIGGGGGK